MIDNNLKLPRNLFLEDEKKIQKITDFLIQNKTLHASLNDKDHFSNQFCLSHSLQALAKNTLIVCDQVNKVIDYETMFAEFDHSYHNDKINVLPISPHTISNLNDIDRSKASIIISHINCLEHVFQTGLLFEYIVLDASSDLCKLYQPILYKIRSKKTESRILYLNDILLTGSPLDLFGVKTEPRLPPQPYRIPEAKLKNKFDINKVNNLYALITDRPLKRSLLTQLIFREKWQRFIVVTQTKHSAYRIEEKLFNSRLKARILHSSLSESSTIKNISKFLGNEINALIVVDNYLEYINNFDSDFGFDAVILFEVSDSESLIESMTALHNKGICCQTYSLICSDESSWIDEFNLNYHNKLVVKPCDDLISLIGKNARREYQNKKTHHMAMPYKKAMDSRRNTQKSQNTNYNDESLQNKTIKNHNRLPFEMDSFEQQNSVNKRFRHHNTDRFNRADFNGNGNNFDKPLFEQRPKDNAVKVTQRKKRNFNITDKSSVS